MKQDTPHQYLTAHPPVKATGPEAGDNIPQRGANRTSFPNRNTGRNTEQNTKTELLTFWVHFCIPSPSRKPLNLSSVPIIFDGRWLRTNGLAHAIRAE